MTESVQATDLSVETVDERYALTLRGNIVTAAMGHHQITHQSRALLDHIRDEFIAREIIHTEGTQIAEPKFFNSYVLFSLQKEWVEPRKDNVTENFTRELLNDPLLNRPPGPERSAQVPRYERVTEWLSEHGLRLVDRDFVSLPDHESEDDSETDTFCRLRDWLSELFAAMSPEQRSAVVFLNNIHHGSLIHGLALLGGQCTPAEYAAGVTAAHCILPVFGVSSRKSAQTRRDFQRDAETALAFVEAYRA